MTWFKRDRAGITTERRDQNDTPEGYWLKCPSCTEIINRRELEEYAQVCPKCGHHFRMTAVQYLDLIFAGQPYTLYDQDLLSVDALSFTDKKPYPERLKQAQAKTNLSDAALSAIGPIGNHRLAIGVMDFAFIGGSMGSVVGEVLSRTIQRAYDERLPLMIISQSGGARMMEGALSLMQMAKTSAHLARYHALGKPYISLMTHPTTGGVTASYAMLGDFNIAEPQALIGFAGPKVIRETIGQGLPEGFQRAEFLVEKGFLDFIVRRKDLRAAILQLLDLIDEPESQDVPQEITTNGVRSPS